MTAPWRLESGWLRTSLSMSGFRDKQRPLVNTVGVPGVAGSSPGKSRGGMSKYGPTTKLIILRRSPKTSLWDSCGLNLHTNTVEIIKYKGKVPVNKKKKIKKNMVYFKRII